MIFSRAGHKSGSHQHRVINTGLRMGYITQEEHAI